MKCFQIEPSQLGKLAILFGFFASASDAAVSINSIAATYGTSNVKFVVSGSGFCAKPKSSQTTCRVAPKVYFNGAVVNPDSGSTPNAFSVTVSPVPAAGSYTLRVKVGASSQQQSIAVGAGIGASLGQSCLRAGSQQGVLVSYTIKGDPAPTITCAVSETTKFIDLGTVVVDKTTSLMWEKKTNNGSVHDGANTYSWAATPNGTSPDGTVFTAFLSSLNTAGKTACNSSDGTVITCATTTENAGCFANHCDWRLPEIDELATIVDKTVTGCSDTSACIDTTLFGPAGNTWSSTQNSGLADEAWIMQFSDDTVTSDTKDLSMVARAVRGQH